MYFVERVFPDSHQYSNHVYPKDSCCLQGHWFVNLRQAVFITEKIWEKHSTDPFYIQYELVMFRFFHTFSFISEAWQLFDVLF